MSDYLSGGIHFSGLASGTDFDTMIDQLKKVESIQMNRMVLWKADWQTRVDGFGEINTEIQSLLSTMQSMDTMNEFMAKTANSSFESVASATTTTGASEGVYKVTVGQLARNSMWTYNAGFAAKTTKVNTSGADQTFQYTYKGKQRTLTVADGTTIEGLVNVINSDPNNPGIKASLIKNGDQYNLQIRGMDLGKANSLTIDSGTNLSALAAPDATYDPEANPPVLPTNWDVQAAQNALIRINDWPSSSFLESETNTLTEVVDGLSITLKDVGTTQISVGTDTDKIRQNIVAFVDGINAVRQKILDLTKVDDNASASDPGDSASQFDAEKGSILTGNYGVQLLSSRLKTAVSGQAAGFDYFHSANGGTGDIYSSLAHVGILTVADQSDPQNGMLSIDMEALDKALAENPSAVAELFAADSIGVTDSADFSFHSQIKGITQPGNYDVTYDVDGAGNIINAKIGGYAAKVDQETHQIISTAGNARGLAVQVNNLSAGSYSDAVRIKQGKAAEMSGVLKGMLDSNGTLKIIEKNYEDIMDQIDQKIDRESDRLIRWERTTRLRFARLEATLTQYNGQMESLSQQLSQLNNS